MISFLLSQAILACSFAEKDYNKVTAAATRVLQMSFVLGVGLSFVVGGGLFFGAGVFSKNVDVIHLIRLGIPVLTPTKHNELQFWILLTMIFRSIFKDKLSLIDVMQCTFKHVKIIYILA